MTSLLEAVRQIGRDLIEKRLWPIAVALLAGVVIVPMLITSSSSDAPAPAAIASVAPPAPTAPSPTPSRDDASSARRSPTGKVRDPFFDPPKPPADTAATSATGDATRAVAAPPGGTDAVNPRAPGATSPPPAGATNPTPSTTRRPSPRAATAPRGSVYYRAVVRWGDSRAAAPHALARLTPLGGRRNPAALYLGVAKADALYAVFVLGPNASSRGEGVCRTGTDCRMIALRAGERRSFVVHSPDGGKQHRFTLRVRSLKVVKTSAAAARRARAKVHRHGRSVLHAMWRLPAQAAVLRRASYDTHVGLLRARPANVEKSAK